MPPAIPDEPRLGLAPVPYMQSSMLLWAGVIGTLYLMYGGLFALSASRR